MAKTTTDTLSLELVASIEGLTTKLDIATSKIRGLQNSVGSLKTVSTSLATSLGAVGTKVDELGKKTEKNKKSIEGISGAFGMWSAAVKTFIATRIADYLTNAINKSMQYTENLNLFAVAMGDYTQQAQGFLNRLSTLGIDPAAATRTMGLFYQVSSSLGLSEKNAYALSETFTKLSYDLASFYNIGVADATTKLQAGLVGETEPLRRIGIVITENNLAETARRLGIEKSIRTMTEAQKIELRYVTTMWQAKNALNDFERTIQNPQNQVKILAMQMDILSRTIGNAFIPILTKVLPYIIAFVKALGMLLGITAKQLGFKQITPSFDTDNSSDYASDLGDAAKNAKKLKDYVMGIDELNIMNKDSGSSADAGGVSGGSLGIDFSKFGYEDIIKAIEDNTTKLIPKMKLLVKVLGVLASAFAALWAVGKITALVEFFRNAEKVSAFAKALKLFAGTLLIVVGAFLLLTNIDNLIKNWETLSTKSKLLSGLLAVLGAGFIALGYAIAVGFSVATLGIGAVIAVVVGVIAAIVSWVSKQVSLTNQLKTSREATIALKDAQKDYTTALQENVDAIKRAEEAEKILREAQSQTKLSGEELYKSVENGRLKYKDMNDAQRKVYEAYINNIAAQDFLRKSNEKVKESNKEVVLAELEKQRANLSTKESYEKYKKAVIDAYESGKISAKDARTKIEQAMAGMSEASKKTFQTDLPNDIKKGLDPNRYESVGTKLKNWFKDVFSTISTGFGALFGGLSPKASVVFKVANGAIQKFANGGFPSMGQMFIANEAGPEMVGTIGGKSAVANNGQIVSAIKQGVIEAMLISNQSRESNINIESKLLLDNEIVYKSQQNFAANRGTAFSSDRRFV